jgi:transposase
VTTFADVMTQRRGRDLEKWITAASSQPQLRPFAAGLRRDQDAVTAGLTLPWSSGVVEGHVNRIKMLKRQCMAAPAPTCSTAASSSPTKRTRSRITQSVPEPKFSRR